MAERFRDKFGGDSLTKWRVALDFAVDFVRDAWPVVLVFLAFVAVVAWLSFQAGMAACK